jgi:phage shock protein E
LQQKDNVMHGPSRFQQLTADAKSRIREVTPIEAAKEQAAGAVLIDVREADEFED